jgi:hypothetical protein
VGTTDAGDGRYRLGGIWRLVPWILGVIVIANGLTVLVDGLDEEGAARWVRLVFGIAALVFGLYLILGTVQAIDVRTDAVRLASRVRTRAIPWADLVAVEPIGRGLARMIVWSPRGERPRRTIARWERQDEMLAAIRRHVAAAHG